MSSIAGIIMNVIFRAWGFERPTKTGIAGINARPRALATSPPSFECAAMRQAALDMRPNYKERPGMPRKLNRWEVTLIAPCSDSDKEIRAGSVNTCHLSGFPD